MDNCTHKKSFLEHGHQWHTVDNLTAQFLRELKEAVATESDEEDAQLSISPSNAHNSNNMYLAFSSTSINSYN